MVRLSVQNAVYTGYIGGYDCQRRKFWTYGDVVCYTRGFTLCRKYEIRLRCVPQPNRRYPAFVKWTFANIPLVRFLYRITIAAIVCHS
jgi:hypothetical protein